MIPVTTSIFRPGIPGDLFKISIAEVLKIENEISSTYPEKWSQTFLELY